MDEISGKKEIALNKAGATREAAYKAYVEALGATIVKYDRDGDHMGEQPDYPTRIKAADSISRLNGDLKESPMIDNRVINVSVGTIEFGVLVHMVKDVAEQLVAIRTSGQQTGEVIDI